MLKITYIITFFVVMGKTEDKNGKYIYNGYTNTNEIYNLYTGDGFINVKDTVWFDSLGRRVYK